MRQKFRRGTWDLAESEYLEIIESKTAALCEVSCRLGAHFAGATREREHELAEYGRLLGIAFQIADDLLDVVGDESVVGKSLGTDLQQQKPTLPLLRALAAVPEVRRKELLAWLSSPVEGLEAPVDSQQKRHATTRDAAVLDSAVRAELAVRRDAVRELLDSTGAAESARQTARQYAASAAELIERLPASGSRTVLLRLAEFVVDRPH